MHCGSLDTTVSMSAGLFFVYKEICTEGARLGQHVVVRGTWTGKAVQEASAGVLASVVTHSLTMTDPQALAKSHEIHITLANAQASLVSEGHL